jgi:hypothetical protein
MRFSNLLLLQVLAVGTITTSYAQESSYSRVETRSSSTTSSSSTSTGSSDKSNQGASSETVTFADKKVFVPKFKERIKNLREQVDFSLGKTFISKDESSKFHSRLDQLHAQEEDLAKRGYPKSELDDLEKGITGLNSDLFKASNKPSGEKAGETTTSGGTTSGAPAKSTGATAEGVTKTTTKPAASKPAAAAPAKKAATAKAPAKATTAKKK